MSVPEQIQEALFGEVTATIDRSASLTSFLPPTMSCPCSAVSSSEALEQPPIAATRTERKAVDHASMVGRTAKVAAAPTYGTRDATPRDDWMSDVDAANSGSPLFRANAPNGHGSSAVPVPRSRSVRSPRAPLASRTPWPR